MARNVEIKARLFDESVQRELARKLTGQSGERIHQVDVFFPCDSGRLKLRLFDEGHGELIFYRRSDQAGPKLSDFVISRTDEPQSLRETLTNAYGVLATVEKERWLFLYGRTRIHLDQVQDLGNFLELEVMLDEEETAHDGELEAEMLMQQLRVNREALVPCAYVDLLCRADRVHLAE